MPPWLPSPGVLGNMQWHPAEEGSKNQFASGGPQAGYPAFSAPVQTSPHHPFMLYDLATSSNQAPWYTEQGMCARAASVLVGASHLRWEQEPQGTVSQGSVECPKTKTQPPHCDYGPQSTCNKVPTGPVKRGRQRRKRGPVGEFGVWTPGVTRAFTKEKESSDTVMEEKDVTGSQRSARAWTWGNPICLAGNFHLCAQVIDQFDVCQELVELSKLTQWLVPATLELSHAKHSTYVIQKALEMATGEDRNLIVKELHGHSLALLECSNGNFVLQKMIEYMPPSNVQFILTEFAENGGGWLAHAKHKYGCRVLQRLLEHIPPEMSRGMCTAFINDVHTLVRDKYGNYVLQHLFEYGSDQVRSALMEALLDHEKLPSLSQCRISSMVLKKALEACGTEGRCVIARSALNDASNGTNAILVMSGTRFGSCVIKRLLECLGNDCPLRAQVVSRLQENIDQVKATKYGRSLARDYLKIPEHSGS